MAPSKRSVRRRGEGGGVPDAAHTSFGCVAGADVMGRHRDEVSDGSWVSGHVCSKMEPDIDGGMDEG